MFLVSLLIPSLLRSQPRTLANFGIWDTSVMIEKFATTRGKVSSDFLHLNHTSKSMFLVSLLIPKFALGPSREPWRTSELGH